MGVIPFDKHPNQWGVGVTVGFNTRARVRNLVAVNDQSRASHLSNRASAGKFCPKIGARIGMKREPAAVRMLSFAQT
jgi:hypothetical protein